MSRPTYFLAIDQGGHASRAIVFDELARIVCQAEQSISTLTPRPDHVEHDANEVVDATRTAITRALAALGDDKRLVKAAGLATQRSSIACWNRYNGEVLAPILSWQDRRQSDWLKSFQSWNTQIHQKTGLFLSPHYGASKLRWCLDNLDAVASAYARHELSFGPMASLLAWHLTREHAYVVDPANASRTLLWNINNNDWDDELLTLFGIDKTCLPPCIHNNAEFGLLDIDGVDIPLTVITGDQSAALFAWGQPDSDTSYINVGTGAFIQRPLDMARLHDRLLTGMVHHDAMYQCYSQEGTINGAACAIQWFADSHNIDVPEQRVQACLDLEITPPLFINTVSGLGSPDWLTNLAPRFIGTGDTNACLLAILESIVFLIQRNLDVMAHDGGNTSRIVISGGLSNLDGLCQRIADLARLPVIRPVEHEASAAGLACLNAGRPANWGRSDLQHTIFTPMLNTAFEQRFFAWSREINKIIAEND